MARNFQSRDYYGSLQKEYDFISDKDLKDLIQQADDSFHTYKLTSVKERMEKLSKLADILEKNIDKDAELISTEMGKPLKEAKEEIQISISHSRLYAEKLEEYLKPQEMKVNDKRQKIVHEPLGVIYIITPFNFPHYQIFKPALASLAMGNVVLVRPADSCPKVGLAVEERFQEAGFKNFYYNVFTKQEQLELLAESPLVKGINFTGSAKAGSKISETAGKYLKKSVMELGGSDPFVVLEDADLKQAVKLAVSGRFGNCGQVCISSKRFIVHEKLYDDFKDKLIDEVKALKVDYPLEKDVDVGPMARQDLADNIERQVKKSVEQGGKLLLGGKRMEKKGNFFEPTIMEITDLSNILFKEEVFGPVLPLFKVKNDLEAVQIANDTEYGLSSVVVGETKHATDIGQKLVAGSTYINNVSIPHPALPFGGTKNSGYGRECGEEGVKEFSNLKLIWIE